MPRRKATTLTDVELEFMRVIWARGEVTTEDLLDALRRQGRRLADGSVRKILAILVAKSHLDRRPEGRGFVYWATMAPDQTKRWMALDMVKKVFDGSAALMVASLIDGNTVSDRERQAIRRLLAEREKEGRK
jgi:BlaI family penicillinase repressor